jgi:hypothetical protein
MEYDHLVLLSQQLTCISIMHIKNENDDEIDSFSSLLEIRKQKEPLNNIILLPLTTATGGRVPGLRLT